MTFPFLSHRDETPSLYFIFYFLCLPDFLQARKNPKGGALASPHFRTDAEYGYRF
jgi:hypothetical protein